MRIGLIAAPVLVSLLAPAASAGLLDALQNSITGLQVAELGISAVNVINLPTAPLWGRAPDEIPEGAVFVDPVASTKTQAVYRSGPSLRYDPATGDVVITAPPMLGPADEFGQRELMSPTSLYVMFGDHLGSSPRIPTLTKYARSSALDTVFPTEKSFREYSVTDFDMGFRPNHLHVDRFRSSNHNGIRVSLDELLAPGLDSDAFTMPAAIPGPASSDIAVTNLGSQPVLPAVTAIVEYDGRWNASGLLRIGPTGHLYSAAPVNVPTPSATVLASVAVAALAWRRSRR